MCRMMYAAALAIIGRVSFDELFDALEAREIARELVRRYIQSIAGDVDREIAMRLHNERIGKHATNADILRVLTLADLQEVESLYGSRVGLAAARGRRQRNHSALRCFLRETRRARVVRTQASALA